MKIKEKIRHLFWRNEARQGATILAGVALVAITWGLLVGSLMPLAVVGAVLLAGGFFAGLVKLLNGFDRFTGSGWNGDE